jgi:hypothetical protein
MACNVSRHVSQLCLNSFVSSSFLRIPLFFLLLPLNSAFLSESEFRSIQVHDIVAPARPVFGVAPALPVSYELPPPAVPCQLWPKTGSALITVRSSGGGPHKNMVYPLKRSTVDPWTVVHGWYTTQSAPHCGPSQSEWVVWPLISQDTSLLVNTTFAHQPLQKAIIPSTILCLGFLVGKTLIRSHLSQFSAVERFSHITFYFHLFTITIHHALGIFSVSPWIIIDRSLKPSGAHIFHV